MRSLLIYRICFFALLLLSFSELAGQDIYFIRVYFRDKGNVSSYQAGDLLSERAINRRQKSGIAVPDYHDFPVNRQYINSIVTAGYTLHCTSKWMNTALFRTAVLPDIESIKLLPYVADAKIVKTPGRKSTMPGKLDFETFAEGQYQYDRPVSMLNGQILHEKGFKGENILIAVLDGGFTSADRIESLDHVRSRNGIIHTYDFVNRSTSVYNASTHGTAVMSILAADIPGFLAGTAPAADFILLKTEDGATEFPCEEDFWAAGAEFADSAGADIISSSLGYYTFDDPSMNYKQQDLNGDIAFVTRVADVAASKGILVVNSAGNERMNPWQKIIFPSDGDSVVAVAAVDENKIIASFSSQGPAADGTTKPDVSAMGVLVPLQTSPGSLTRANGTSFSCPVISGMSACLMQAFPEASNYDVIKALHEGSDRHNNPDALYGYGIPDMVAVMAALGDKYLIVPEEEILISPNPGPGSFNVIFKTPPGTFTLEIFSISGKLIYKETYSGYAGRLLNLEALQSREQGLYIIRIKTQEGIITGKIIKSRH